MSQVSGSIALDMTKVTVEIDRAVQAAVLQAAWEIAESYRAALFQLQRTLDALAASANRSTLNHAEMIATLSCHLPAGLSTDALGDGHRVAEFQADRLAQAGYALVAVSGPALEHAVNTGNVLTDFTAVAKAAAGVRPSSPGGTIRVNGQPAPTIEYVTTAQQRADERLAQARRDGAADSWFEGDER